MRRIFATLLPLALVACTSQTTAPKPATAFDTAAATSRAVLGEAVLQTTSVRLAALNPAMAKRYDIDTSEDGVLLLITLRDAKGEALAPHDLALTATAAVLPAPPQPLPLRAVQTGAMTDYIGVLHAKPPASMRFQLQARRNGASSEIATTVELSPR